MPKHIIDSGNQNISGDLSLSGNLSASNIGSSSAKNYTQSDTPPSNPQTGDQWLNTSTMQKYDYYDGFWVETAGAAVTRDSVQTALSSGDYAFGGQITAPNQTASTDNSVVTRKLAYEDDLFNIGMTFILLPLSYTQGGGTAGQSGYFSRWFIGGGIAGSSIGPNYGTIFGGDFNAGGQTPASTNLGLALAQIGLSYANGDIVFGVGLPDTLPVFGQPYLTGAGIGFAIKQGNNVVLFAHNGTNYVESSPVNIPVTNGRTTPFILTSNGQGRVRLFSNDSTQIHKRVLDTPFLEISGGPSTGNYANNGNVRFRTITNNSTTTTIVAATYQVRALINPSFS